MTDPAALVALAIAVILVGFVRWGLRPVALVPVALVRTDGTTAEPDDPEDPEEE